MDESRQQFVEQMGNHLEEDGVPRIAGRLLGVLMLNARPASLDELTEQLEVSKGSVSSNARLLEQWGVAERVKLPGDRRDYYQIAPDVERQVLEQQMGRTRALLDRLQQGREAVAGDAADVRQRFDRVISFQQRALQLLSHQLDRMNRR